MKEIQIPVHGFGMSSSEYGQALFEAVAYLEVGKEFIATLKEIPPMEELDPLDADPLVLVLKEKK